MKKNFRKATEYIKNAPKVSQLHSRSQSQHEAIDGNSMT